MSNNKHRIIIGNSTGNHLAGRDCRDLIKNNQKIKNNSERTIKNNHRTVSSILKSNNYKLLSNSQTNNQSNHHQTQKIIKL